MVTESNQNHILVQCYTNVYHYFNELFLFILVFAVDYFQLQHGIQLTLSYGKLRVYVFRFQRQLIKKRDTVLATWK